MRKWIVMVIFGILCVASVMANPFDGEMTLTASDITFDMSVITDTIIGWFNANWAAIVSVLVISIGVPFSIKLFKKVLK